MSVQKANFVDQPLGQGFYLTRIIEIVISLMILVLTLPIMVVIAAIIRLDTPGPVLFFQKRVGLNGKSFTFVKFRTLYADARERFPELYAYNYSDEEIASLHFKVEDDPRVTPQGKWLRRSSLDELPNFINVLSGDMAFVGPRPEIPEMLPYYKGGMLRKFSVRPGVTGLAQISGRGRLGFLDTVDIDLDYVSKKNPMIDIKIILKTLYMIITRDGAF